MSVLELSDIDIIKILKNAFPDVDTVRLEARTEGITIFGVDEANVLYSEILIGKKAFEKYEVSPQGEGITISFDAFKRVVEIGPSDSLTDFNSLIISFGTEYIDVQVKGESFIREDRIFDIPTGTRERPPLTGFSNAPHCNLNVIKDFRLVYRTFKPSESQEDRDILVNMEADSGEILFKSMDPSFESKAILKGKIFSSGKTMTSTYILGSVSKVSDLDAIRRLIVHLINDGNMKFSYSFDNGELNYLSSGYVA